MRKSGAAFRNLTTGQPPPRGLAAVRAAAAETMRAVNAKFAAVSASAASGWAAKCATGTNPTPAAHVDGIPRLLLPHHASSCPAPSSSYALLRETFAATDTPAAAAAAADSEAEYKVKDRLLLPAGCRRFGEASRHSIVSPPALKDAVARRHSVPAVQEPASGSGSDPDADDLAAVAASAGAAAAAAARGFSPRRAGPALTGRIQRTRPMSEFVLTTAVPAASAAHASGGIGELADWA